MYLEGSDQHRGWFQSSLLIGLGTRGRPPFREVLTHGFLIDVDGRKMSKSIGNVIAPQDVIKESGAEVLRLWVAMSDYSEELRVGKQILARVVEAYRKFRNTLRYLASNLYDFDPARDMVAADALQEVDRYILSRYGETCDAVVKAYARYDYPGIFQTLNQFLTVDLSAFYADVSKDHLYTLAASSAERRSAQTAMYRMADGLARLLAPILPVTADELWKHLPASVSASAAREASVHLALFPSDAASLVQPEIDARWQRLRSIRDDVNRALENARQEKIIGTSLQAHVRLAAGGTAADLLQRYEAELPMLFIVSLVTIEPGGPEGVSVSVTRAEGEKCERCWRTVPEVTRDGRLTGLCSRCVDALGPDGDREVA
jgi:isoleucyl-tRNA synthetase